MKRIENPWVIGSPYPEECEGKGELDPEVYDYYEELMRDDREEELLCEDS